MRTLRAYRTWPSRKRPAWIADVLMVVATGTAVAMLAGLLWRWYQQHSGLVTGDPYWYVMSAKSLSRGHFILRTHTAEAVAALSPTAFNVSGPMWNTSVLEGARLVFTVGVGYPLWLALMLTLGGIRWCIHSNYPLLALVFLLFGLAIWESLGRTRRGLAVAVSAVTLFCLSSYQTLWQFSMLWREPLTYGCLLAAVYALVRFGRCGRWWWVVGSAFCVGYAVSVKEANAIYVPAFGLAGLSLPAFRRHPRKACLIGAAVTAFSIGLLPIVLQNLISTGNPLISLQTLRETREYSLTDAGAGLSAGNTGETVRRYIGLYSGHVFFGWPFMLLLLGGLARSWKTSVGRLMLGLLALHVGVYIQWGNAEFRHMLLAHMPYAFFVAYSLIALTVWPRRLRLPRKTAAMAFGRTALCNPGIAAVGRVIGACLMWVPVLILGLAIRPVARRVMPPIYDVAYAQVADFCGHIEARLPPNAVLLVNRFTKDVMGVYTDTETLCLQEWSRITADGDPVSVLRWQIARGVRIFFLDSIDRSPRNHGLVNWQTKDEAMLLSGFDLEPLDTIDALGFGMHHITGRHTVTLYEVRPWQASVTHESHAVPETGMAFLECWPRNLGADLKIAVAGQQLPFTGSRFHALMDEHRNGAAVNLTLSASGGVVPSRSRSRLIDWHQPLVIPFGSDALPPDNEFFPDGLGRQDDRNVRAFNHPVRLRVPVREGPECFSFLRLLLYATTDRMERDTLVRIMPAGLMAHDVSVRNSPAVHDYRLVPVLAPLPPSVVPGTLLAGTRDLVLAPAEGASLHLESTTSETAWRRIAIRTPADAVQVALQGVIVPDPYDDRYAGRTVRLEIDATELATLAFDDGYWNRHPDKCVLRFNPRVMGVTEHILTVYGGGIAQLESAALTPRMRIHPEGPGMLFLEGFYAVEGSGPDAFCWSREAGSLQVAFNPDADVYRLTLDCLDGLPRGPGRELVLTLEGEERRIALPAVRGAVVAEWAIEPRGDYMHGAVNFQVEAWNPSLVERTQDARWLGFRLYGVEWEPVVRGAGGP